MANEQIPGGAEITGTSRVNALGEPDRAGNYIQIAIATAEGEHYHRISVASAVKMIETIQSALAR